MIKWFSIGKKEFQIGTNKHFKLSFHNEYFEEGAFTKCLDLGFIYICFD